MQPSNLNFAVFFSIVVALLAAKTTLGATVYEVGDDKPYKSIGSVPLEEIGAGDSVLIYWREEPYREKWVIAARGAQDAPITFRGVPGPAGQLPVIDGENATTRRELSYWNEERSVIKIGGSSIPENDGAPAWIIVEQLEIRGARPPRKFLDDGGGSGDPVRRDYINNAAAIYIEYGEHITIRNCTFTDCGNGLFVASSDDVASREVLVEGCHIYGNGNKDSLYEHNVYTEALGITYQFNRFGPLADGALGNNLKDRSGGLVVRYNWIEGGNRQLDLVDAEGSGIIRDDPAYAHTFIYGNVLIEPAGAGNRQIIHYGGDSGNESAYRKGVLELYHNTLVSTRTDRTTLLRLSTMDETCEARNNILFVGHAGNQFSMLDNTGRLTLRHNWMKPGWVKSFDGDPQGTIDDDGSSIYGTDPGFVDAQSQDFTLKADSKCIDQGGPLSDGVPSEHEPAAEYVRHQQGRSRRIHGAAADIGAFEYAPTARGDLNCDGGINFEDIDPFVSALISQREYERDYPACEWTNGDINRDGGVDFADIDGFVDCLTKGGCP